MEPETAEQAANGAEPTVEAVVEENKESEPSSSTRSVPAPFLNKTYELVDDEETNDIVSWSEEGNTFVVWNANVFAKDILPKYFKHNNFASFVRQLNTYGFRKTTQQRWEFSNDNFKRGKKDLLKSISRRKQPHQRLRALEHDAPALNLSSNYLLLENERLRRDNALLITEISRLRQVFAAHTGRSVDQVIGSSLTALAAAGTTTTPATAAATATPAAAATAGAAPATATGANAAPATATA
mmetsp:Transcript_1464/g.5046  ORF Transcript_1464/g.5046 Transcript_1464/m.5046 type:complete len:241 (-) Transcript_1464:383-1105(-)